MMDQGGQPQEQVPPGWYPDGAGNQRWWDGTQWAENVPVAPATASSQDPKTIAALVHASGILFGFIGPLVGYLVWPQDPFIKENSRNALNFQITMMIGFVISFVLTFVIIGIFMMLGLMLAILVLHILAAVDASKGKTYSYPLTIEFIKG